MEYWLRYKWEQAINTHSNMTKSQKHHAQVKKPDCKIYDSIYMVFWEIQNYRKRKMITSCLGSSWRRELIAKVSKPRHFPNPGIKLESPVSPALAGGCFNNEPLRKPTYI